MIRPGQLLDFIIRPTLDYMADVSNLPLNSDAAANLLLGTAAAETKLGTYIYQHPAGPALGIYQIEPRTFTDMMEWIERSPPLMSTISPFMCSKPFPTTRQIIGNLYLATAASRLYYWRVSAPMPRSDDLQGLAGYWKKWYNTALGRGTVDHFIQCWIECGLDKAMPRKESPTLQA